MKTIVKISSLDRILQNIEKKQKIVIYGAGDAGKRVLKYIFSSWGGKKENIRVVVSVKHNDESICGVPICEVNDLLKEEAPIILVAAMHDKKYEMAKTALGYSDNVYTFDEGVICQIGEKIGEPIEIKNDKESYNIFKSQARKLLKYEVHLAEHCNLNCKSCFHYSSIAEEEYLNIDEYARDCKRLSELFGGMADEIHLMGGEPLLNPDIEKFIEVTRKCFPLGKINIVTNGLLLLKMPESFWRKCERYGVVIEPTKYPIKIDYDAIEKKADAYNVEISYFNKGEVEKKLWFNPIDVEGKQSVEKKFFGM